MVEVNVIMTITIIVNHSTLFKQQAEILKGVLYPEIPGFYFL